MVEVKNNRDELNNELERKKAKILEMIGLKWQEICTKIVTVEGIVDTGRLRASLSYCTPDKDSGLNKFASSEHSEAEDALSGHRKENSIIVGTNVDYAMVQEMGSDGSETRAPRPARPFLRPSIEEYKDSYENIAKQVFEE